LFLFNIYIIHEFIIFLLNFYVFINKIIKIITSFILISYHFYRYSIKTLISFILILKCEKMAESKCQSNGKKSNKYSIIHCLYKWFVYRSAPNLYKVFKIDSLETKVCDCLHFRFTNIIEGISL
jgi:hypothetical protein